jgi:hypothetical protein
MRAGLALGLAAAAVAAVAAGGGFGSTKDAISQTSSSVTHAVGAGSPTDLHDTTATALGGASGEAASSPPPPSASGASSPNTDASESASSAPNTSSGPAQSTGAVSAPSTGGTSTPDTSGASGPIISRSVAAAYDEYTGPWYCVYKKKNYKRVQPSGGSLDAWTSDGWTVVWGPDPNGANRSCP